MKRFLGLRGDKLTLGIVFIAGLDFLLFGYDMAYMGGILSLRNFLETFPEMDTLNPPPGRTASETSTIQGVCVASYCLGCWVGAIATIWLGDILGRRKMIWIGTFLIAVGATIQCSSFQLAQLVTGRVVAGLGNGMNTSTVPNWASETAKPHNRGKLVSIPGALIVGGVCLATWVNLGFSFTAPNEVSWRFPIALQLLFCVLILIGLPFLPESPRWLAHKGRDADAREVLSALYNKDGDAAIVEDAMIAMKESLAVVSKWKFVDMFKMNKDRNLHRVGLTLVIQAISQTAGIALVTAYAPKIYEESIGMSPFMSRLLTAITQTEYFMFVWVPVFTLEHLGRRVHLIISSAGMTVCMAVLAGCTKNASNKACSVIAVLCVFLYNNFYAMGYCGPSWLYGSEILPLSIRAQAFALGTSVMWSGNFMVSMIVPVSIQNIQWKTYLIFAAFNAAAVPILYFFFPDTTRRSLEEMDEIFHRTSSIFEVVKVAKEKPYRFGKKGELLISFLETDEHRAAVDQSGGMDPTEIKDFGDSTKA